jgi:basic membrane protein A and related proteins
MRSRWMRLAALGMAAALVGGACAGEEEAPQAGQQEEEAEHQVAMIIAQGGLGDQSYNDLANEGLTRAEEDFGFEARRVESDDIVAQGEAVLRQAGQAGFDLVVDLEFTTSEALTSLAPEFPDTQWTFMNLPLEGDNISSFVFAEHEGSYLAGALAAMVTSDTSIEGINEEKVIGVIGGTKSVGIDKFLVGYMQGAQAVDPDVEVLVRYSEDFGDPATGKQLAEAMFEQGADIVYQVAGGTGLGVIEAAEENGRYAIGVDTDQSNLAPAAVLTSMVKRVDLAVYRSVEMLDAGELGGQVVNLDLAAEGVELGTIVDGVPDEYVQQVDDLRGQIIAGDIEPWDVVEQGYPDWFE